ncbi:MAG: hypothetical protein GWP91_03810 [Rhodobacterales bacterium]|nr:hypothetical protein [Rhodobacterales bacterium]
MSGLVAMAVLPDLEAAKLAARQLVDETVALDVDGGGAEKVGGGLGFIQIAEDPFEVVDGLASAALGCGACHRAAHVDAPEVDSWSHHSAGRRLIDDAVWARPPQSPSAEGLLAEVAEAWASATPATDTDAVDLDQQRLTLALGACVRCHQSR